MLVVADGRLHEKEALRARVRELAAKKGVCLAFIAVDSPTTTTTTAAGSAAAEGGAAASTAAAGRPGAAAGGSAGPRAGAAGAGQGGGGSLLDIEAVSFADGRPVLRRYLDDFPFPYYVLLRDIGALPRTLADLLRQWFELSTAGH